MHHYYSVKARRGELYSFNYSGKDFSWDYTSTLIIFALTLLFPAIAMAQTDIDASRTYIYPLTSEITTNRFVSDSDDACAVFINPAGLAMRKHSSFILSGTYTFDHLEDFTTASGGNFFGLGFNYIDYPGFSSKTYCLAISAPLSRHLSIGTSLKWNRTGVAESRAPFSIDVGLMLRPSRYMSIGAVWRNANNPSFSNGHYTDALLGKLSTLDERYDVALSVRPLTELLTISAQCEFSDNRKPGWRFGGRLNLTRGIELFGAYSILYNWPGDKEYREFSAGLSLALNSGVIRTSTRSRVNGDFNYSKNTFAIETRDAFVKNAIITKKKFAEVYIGGYYVDEGGESSILGIRNKNLHTILSVLNSIAEDDDIKGLLLKIGWLRGSFIGPVSANLYEIRKAILKVKEAGKPVVAYLDEGGTTAELYLASAADKIVCPYEAPVALFGVAIELKRMKRLFEKLGIEWDHYTAGAYKSSFHTSYTDTTTALQREEIESLVMESFELITSAIASSRGLSQERVKELADGKLFLPEEAIKEKLIDRHGWEKEAKEELGKLAGVKNPDKINTVKIKPRRYWSERWTPPPVIAVVGAYGEIASGESGRSFFNGQRIMGSKTVVRQLKAASSYPGVRAIVLRVDSPGGSALASDEILKEIVRIKKEKKLPVIISMSDVAGSGGYWISMMGDRIFADPFTVTGSIGVAFARQVFQKLYEKAGITREVFKSSEHADAFTSGRHLSEDEMQMLIRFVDHAYDRFVELVAEGRGMSVDEVRKIAEGRVYFGTQAKKINLVDEIGGLKEAIEYAAKSTGIDKDYRTVYFKAFPGFLEKLLKGRLYSGVIHHIAGFITGVNENGFEETVVIY